MTVREALAYPIFVGAKTWSRLCSKQEAYDFVNGSLNEGPYEALELDTMLQEKHSFSDFDIYTIQREPYAWEDFCEWRSAIAENAARHPLSPGDILFGEKDACIRLLEPLRSLLPNPNVPQLDKVHKRPRHVDLDAFLAPRTDFRFEATRALHTGPDKYSQVVLGRFVGSEHTVCVRVFDERRFPVNEDDYEDLPDEKRLLDLHFADDLVRCEESAYHYLEHLQGSVIPHCYGFHQASVSCVFSFFFANRRMDQFTFPDGWRAFGLVMEVIEGNSFDECGCERLAIDEQAVLVSKIYASGYYYELDVLHSFDVFGRRWGQFPLLALNNRTGISVRFYVHSNLEPRETEHRTLFLLTSPSPICASVTAFSIPQGQTFRG